MRFITVEASEECVELTAELGAALPAVEGDFVQLEQVVPNLIRSGIEALDSAQQKKRSLAVRTFSNNLHEVELTVRDAGPGVPREVAPRLFEPMLSTKSGGLGIGLYITKTVVEAHGGRIRVDPGTRRGATFHVALFSSKTGASRADSTGPVDGPG